jgi:prepilin-type N-terminal cleavage/methylation domain-containing protein/prepilin-type processing-associated H-X9-DG protein
MPTCDARRGTFRGRAFTLVEVLVVIGLIAVLIGILLPAVGAARDKAKLVQCAANLHQLGTGLQGYASAHRGRFPPSLSFPSPGMFWYDPERIGAHVSFTLPHPLARPGGPVFTCPNDDNAQRSYAMNVWASSAIDPWLEPFIPPGVRLWGSNPRLSSQLILLTETWSSTGAGIGPFYALPTVGFRGNTPGDRFGGGAGVVPPFFAGPWGQVNCELAYMRHRKRKGPGVATEPRGMINIAYADGHVDVRTDDELVSRVTGQSTRDSMWCPGF